MALPPMEERPGHAGRADKPRFLDVSIWWREIRSGKANRTQWKTFYSHRSDACFLPFSPHGTRQPESGRPALSIMTLPSLEGPLQ